MSGDAAPARRGHAAGWLAMGLAVVACTLSGAIQAQSARVTRPPAGTPVVEARPLPDADAEAASRALLADAVAQLPASWRDGRHPPIRIDWRDDLPPGVHGRAFGRTVRLDRALLEGWRRRDPSAGLDDARARAALAAVVHEIAHVRDRTAGDGLSGDPRLRELAGWQRQPLRPWRTANAFSDRSPDAGERRSPAEFVAVNLEHFLLDPEYACRRPALHRHFAARLDHAPPGASCAPGLPMVVATGDGDDDAAHGPLGLLDPGRVLAVEYLLADADEGAAGRFGHAMLRLVICAPGRPRGPGCRHDLDHHRVLSFRAFVDDVQVSSWRGLSGGYPSRLFVLPLGRVVDDYTRVQLRGLRSIPLRLERDEITALLERAAAVHWSYDGRYAFVGNNCAVETWKLLHGGVPRLAALPLRSITPNGLLRRLRRTGVADLSVFADADAATRLGHAFPSAVAEQDRVFAVARAALALPDPDARAWMARDPATRAPFIARADLRAAAALLVLEHAARRRQALLARDALKRLLAGAGSGRIDPSEGDEVLRAWLREADVLSRPASLAGGATGYGLPQAVERAHLAAVTAERAGRLRGLGVQLEGQARAALPDDLQRTLAAVDGNLEALGVRLRALAAD